MKTSIIVTTWSEKSKPYLDACVKSIHNLNYPKDKLEVIIVGKKSYQPQYEGCLTIAPDSDSFCNEVGLNYGLEHAAKDSQFLFILNDDVILTKDCLKNMIDMCDKQDFILNATSNCDNHWKYHLMFGFKEGENLTILNDRYYRYDDLAPKLDNLMNAESFYAPGMLYLPFLCMYATLIPRAIYEKIGAFDQEYNGAGPSDLDYCMRADQLGIRYAVALHAVIWHFGGATSDKNLTFDDRVKNTMYFFKKWGKLPLETTHEMREELEKRLGHKITDYLCKN